jgi:hypothetical protein
MISPAFTIASFTHAITDMMHPLHLYPYILLIFSPELMGWITNVLFGLACFWLMTQDVGSRVSMMAHVTLVGVQLVFGPIYATMIVSTYACVVHAPLHYRRCFKRRELISLWVAIVWYASVFCFVKMMPRNPLGFTLSCGAQQIVVCHALSRASVERARGHLALRYVRDVEE